MVQRRDNIKLDIIELLLRKEYHVRGIAQELGESHSTVARKLRALKSEGVVDSKTEGRNKIFFLKENVVAKTYIAQAELHKKAKLLLKHPELGVIFEDVLKKTDAPLVVLFGSYAKGLAKKESDIDIYIETTSRNVKKVVEEIHSKISVKIGPFDTSSPLIREIIKNHIIVRGVEVFHEKQ